jgi:methyltransferase (TIGR00027 family)
MDAASPPSRSAMSAAVARGTHRLWDEPPWLVDDPFALVLVGPGWEEFASAARSLVREQVWRRGHAFVQLRTRYPEDRLIEGGFGQYVILGAGLDSFAWRRPDLLARVRVFEVDHPATQSWKRERARALGLATSDDHVFVAVDFETQGLGECLDASGFDSSRPALFSWVGTTMYLTAGAIESTLAVIAHCARGSEIVMGYNVAPEHCDDFGREYLAAFTPTAIRKGEPLASSYDPAAMEELIARCGLTVSAHPTSEDLDTRYCSARTDGLRPLITLERLVVARRA